VLQADEQATRIFGHLLDNAQGGRSAIDSMRVALVVAPTTWPVISVMIAAARLHVEGWTNASQNRLCK
jgi:hypothetical protein